MTVSFAIEPSILGLQGIEWVDSRVGSVVSRHLAGEVVLGEGDTRGLLGAPASCLGAPKKAVDMWTIRFAERLRFPRVPCLGRLAAVERGEMLAFAHIPTASAIAPIFGAPRMKP